MFTHAYTKFKTFFPTASLRTFGNTVHSCARSTLVILLMIGLNLTGVGVFAEQTIAYYNDTEASAGNSFQAGSLDYSLSKQEHEAFLGLEAQADIDFASAVMKTKDSFDFQYNVGVEKISGSTAFCNAIDFEAEHGLFSYDDSDGTYLNFTRSTTTQQGTFEFDYDLDRSAENNPHAAECVVDIVFNGWREDTKTPEKSGYTDEERIRVRLKNRMIVMNEFLPNPDGKEYGFDFGDDHSDMPQGEWVELYNNSNHDFDVSGWHIEDEAGNIIPVTASNTQPATTTVQAKQWLVIYMNKAVLNNSGDTIRLVDAAGNIIDEYTYDGDTYCDSEPTANATNTNTTSGSCTSVPPNKSYARQIDGIGAWVDPVPTPGAQNVMNATVTPNALEESTSADSESGATTTDPLATTTVENTGSTTNSTDSTQSDQENNSDDEGMETNATGTDAGAPSDGIDDTSTSTSDSEVEENTSTSTATTSQEIPSSTSAPSSQSDEGEDSAGDADPIEKVEKAGSTNINQPKDSKTEDDGGGNGDENGDINEDDSDEELNTDEGEIEANDGNTDAEELNGTNDNNDVEIKTDESDGNTDPQTDESGSINADQDSEEEQTSDEDRGSDDTAEKKDNNTTQENE